MTLSGEPRIGKRDASASMDLVRILLYCVQQLGLDPGPVRSAVGSAFHDPAARISIERLAEVWHVLAQRSGDPNFGLHCGEVSDQISAGSVLFSIMAHCATIESALEKLARYHALMTDFVRLRLSLRGQYAFYAWEPVVDAIPLDRHYTESVFCGLVFPLRRLTQNRVHPVEIHFTHAQPRDTTEHQRIFQCPLVFDCLCNELVLPKEDLEEPIFLANARVLDTLEHYAQEVLDRLYAPGTWSERVVQLIQKCLFRGETPTLKYVASELAFSPRQLQNKLREEEVTYQMLLDQVRKEAALKYLGEPRATLCDIAFLLGFSEQSAFTRAFKRWTGVTPGVWAQGEGHG